MNVINIENKEVLSKRIDDILIKNIILILREPKRFSNFKDKKRHETVYRHRAHKVTHSMSKLALAKLPKNVSTKVDPKIKEKRIRENRRSFFF